MKTCRKCKKSVPNNMKICKYCGTDLSKINKKRENTSKRVNSTKNKINKNNEIKIEKEEVLEKKEEVFENDELSSFNILEGKQKNNNEFTKAKEIYYNKKKLVRKKIKKIILVIILIFLGCYLGYELINNSDDFGYIVKGNENLNDVTFDMNDTIIYNDIKYVVNGVETSTGTAYKKPKKNNIYIIISLSLENDSESKYHYSGTYFTVLKSNEEEATRIISPVNAGDDLYSGDLVLGGKKEGSIVFEIPETDKEVYLQYYNPDELDQYEQIKDEEQELLKPTPKFRIKINVN